MTGQRTSRRTVLTSAAALATSAVFFARPAIAQSAPRVVIVGGGFAGASAARALRRADPRIAITLVEANQTFTACPFSNGVIAGLRDLTAQQFGYDKVAADGIAVAITAANAVDPATVVPSTSTYSSAGANSGFVGRSVARLARRGSRTASRPRPTRSSRRASRCNGPARGSAP